MTDRSSYRGGLPPTTHTQLAESRLRAWGRRGPSPTVVPLFFPLELEGKSGQDARRDLTNKLG